MKNGKCNFKFRLNQLSDFLWCGESAKIAELEHKIVALSESNANLYGAEQSALISNNQLRIENWLLNQENLGYDIALDIERRAWASKFFELTNKITAQESVLYEVDKRRIELIKLSESRRIQLIVVSAALFAVSVLAIVEMCGGVA